MPFASAGAGGSHREGQSLLQLDGGIGDFPGSVFLRASDISGRLLSGLRGGLVIVPGRDPRRSVNYNGFSIFRFLGLKFRNSLRKKIESWS